MRGGILGHSGLGLSGIGGKRGIDLPCHKKPNEYRWDEGGREEEKEEEEEKSNNPNLKGGE